MMMGRPALRFKTKRQTLSSKPWTCTPTCTRSLQSVIGRPPQRSRRSLRYAISVPPHLRGQARTCHFKFAFEIDRCSMVKVQGFVQTIPIHQLLSQTGPRHQHHVTHTSTKLDKNPHQFTHSHVSHPRTCKVLRRCGPWRWACQPRRAAAAAASGDLGTATTWGQGKCGKEGECGVVSVKIGSRTQPM